MISAARQSDARLSFCICSSVFINELMIVNKQMQKGAKVRAGMKARFRMEPDPEGRAAPEAPELDKALRVSRQLQKFYQSLSPSTRREIAKWVASAKQAETRVRRAERTAEL